MNSISSLYEKMWQESIEGFSNKQFELDAKISSNSDSRRGLTLLTRLSDNIYTNISGFLKEVNSLSDGQYCYPKSDLHVTILSIISCIENFTLESINLNDYIELINKSLSNIESFKISFKGVTASNSCIMLQGFPENDSLDKLRNQLRENFKASGLDTSIDSRYSIATAHSTIVRFQKPILKPELLIHLLSQYRKYEFGTIDVAKLEFVFNDWYQKKVNTNVLSRHKLICA